MPAPLDALFLARAQFGFTIAFHIIFPAMSIGLASYLAVLEGAWLVTGKPVYLAVFRYWLTIFAVVFGVGVVAGLVMSYEFGTNWAGFAPYTVYGHLRTADSVSPIAAPGVATSLAAFGVVYLIVFGAAMVFLLRLMARPPSLATQGPPKDKPHRSAGIAPGPAQRPSTSATSETDRHDSDHD
jgi:cytochrome bd-type quinol oxidase subunit 1